MTSYSQLVSEAARPPTQRERDHGLLPPEILRWYLFAQLSNALRAARYARETCISCGEVVALRECGRSRRPCGHHCNCSWLFDKCCWCGCEFGGDC